MTETEAFEFIKSHLDKIVDDLNKITNGGEFNEYDLTNLTTICILLGVKSGNVHNGVYQYVRNNWQHLESIGCTKTKGNGNYKLSFRGILDILNEFNYNFKSPQQENKIQQSEVVVDNNFQNIIEEKRRILVNKYNELNDEYIYRGEQLKKLSQAIDSLNLLADIDNFVVW